MGFSVYDLLKEAEGDENQDQAPAETDTQTSAEAPAENDAGDNDDFDIDADLDNNEDNAEDNANEPDDFATDDNYSSNNTTDDSEDDPVEDNTDIFASLTAEEQQMKIMELKSQYNSLYTSCDDLLEKINDLDVDEDSLEFVSRITNTLFELKKYIADYLIYTFADKSFIENDIMFNRFLSIIKSIDVVFSKFEKRVDRDKDNIQK